MEKNVPALYCVHWNESVSYHSIVGSNITIFSLTETFFQILNPLIYLHYLENLVL